MKKQPLQSQKHESEDSPLQGLASRWRGIWANHVFVHLHCHSHYSFLRGVGSPEELVAAAKAQQMPAVALTDTNGLYGAVEFYKAALEAEIKPIIGVTLDVAFHNSEGDIRNTKTETRNTKREIRNSSRVALTLLAMDMEGYSNLCQLVTLRHLGTTNLKKTKHGEEEEGRPVFVEELAKHHKGVIALCPLPAELRDASEHKGAMYRAPTKDNRDGDENLEWIAKLKQIFGERLYIEVQHLSAGEGRKLREAERIGRELGVPLVATNTVYFLKAEEHLHHRAVNAIRTGGLLTTVGTSFADAQGKSEITTAEAWFKPAGAMQQLFPDHPELLRATLEIAERCNLKLELGNLILPEYKLPKNETADSYLAKLSLVGSLKRYGSLRADATSRLVHELRVIKKKGLAAYFLLVWEIVQEAGRRGIPAVARGSAASSMVTYCLGISCVCPLRWGLYFERFLNEQRGDCPDIDIDICGARRDELLDYVYENWGAEHVAMIGSFITMHARLAVREVAKVFGVPPMEVNRFTKRLPHRPVREILQAIRDLPECRDLPVDDEPWKTILQVALRLDGAPRHTGIHPCGTVIAALPLNRLTPLERSTKGIVVTQYEMNAIEALGLIKMDLLGQRGFTTMALALDNIEKKKATETNQKQEKREVAPDGMTPRPKARVLDFSRIPENDIATCDVIAAGRTMGIFQIESPAMRGLLRTMGARTLEEVAQALALIRPGAAEYGSKESFVKRMRGEEPVRYAHPILEEILGDSLGVCIFQEQVMQISQAVGNMTLAEADLVRRTASKFAGRGDRDRLLQKFDKAAGIMGWTKEQKEEAWVMVEKFAGFGFCKAHAATYADISYRMAYLKTHHTAEFLAAMCSAGAGFYHVSAYVEEAKRWGIEVRLPSVNHSQMEYTAEGGKNGKRALRIGLMQVKGLRIETITAIVRSREENGAFLSLDDFLQRISVEEDEIESLIKCGAFDDVCKITRPEMLWRWNLLQSKEQIVRLDRPNKTASIKISSRLFAEPSTADVIGVALSGMKMAEYTLEQRLRHERNVLEVCVSGHPLDFLPRNGEVWSDELPRLCGKQVALCGWLVTYRHVGTKNYRNMMFVTLEDQRGIYEVVMFPDAYDRCGGVVFESRTLRVTGRVEIDGQINCEMLTALKSQR